MKNQTEVSATYLELTEKCKEVRIAKKEATKLRRENQELKNLLNRIEDGDLSRREIERMIKEHIQMNDILQKISKED